MSRTSSNSCWNPTCIASPLWPAFAAMLESGLGTQCHRIYSILLSGRGPLPLRLSLSRMHCSIAPGPKPFRSPMRYLATGV